MKRSLDDLNRDILTFRDERNGRQFLSPKDLPAAITVTEILDA